MKIPRILHRASLMACLALLATSMASRAAEGPVQAIPDAIDAYIYGYPL